MVFPRVVVLLSLFGMGANSALSLSISSQLPAAPVSCDAQGVDGDRDGLSDRCELAMATRHAPLLNVSANGCNVVKREAAKRLGGGYLYAVARIQEGYRIAYMPAYFRDCGWHGLKCRLPWINCEAHWGDSEFIVVDIAPQPDHYSVVGIFLSAHCFGKSGSGCRWFRGKDLVPFQWNEQDVSPVVWVANGRNANYRSQRSCERGHWAVDTCSGERLRYRFPIRAESNVGSRSVPRSPRGCVPSQYVDDKNEHTSPGAVECLWDVSMPFGGWQKGVKGVTTYSRYLDVFAGM